MLLAVDIGNSAIKFGVFDGEKLTNKFSIPTKRESTAGEIGTAVSSVKAARIDSVIVCSVVPDVNDSIAAFILEATGREPVFVTNTFDFGLKINYEPLESLGTDRLVNAFAAVEKYGAPCIVCSLGTATTIDVVSADREFLGGIIAPGIDAMAEVLHVKTAKLPHVQIEKPENILGNSTAEAIRSGVYYGYLAMLGGLIKDFKERIGDAKLIATGGRAQLLSELPVDNQEVDADLLLSGLKLLATKHGLD